MKLTYLCNYYWPSKDHGYEVAASEEEIKEWEETFAAFERMQGTLAARYANARNSYYQKLDGPRSV